MPNNRSAARHRFRPVWVAEGAPAPSPVISAAPGAGVCGLLPAEVCGGKNPLCLPGGATVPPVGQQVPRVRKTPGA